MEFALRPENEHVLRVGDRKVLVAAKSMGLFEMEPLTADILDYVRARSRCTSTEVLAALGEQFLGEEVHRAVQELVEMEILVPASASRQLGHRAVDVSRFPLTSLVLNLTNKCNMHCSYCYEPDDAKYGALAQSMDWETASASVDFLFERAGANRQVNLIFFGGEVLLNFRLLQRVVAYASECAEKVGKTVDFSITTNGSLLTDGVIDFLQQYRFGITVSIDGPKDIQDKRRRLGKSNGSYDVVAARVERLMMRYTVRPVVARVTVTKGGLEIARIYEHLTRLGFFEVGFAPVTARKGAEYGLEAADLAELLAQFQELGGIYLERGLRNQYTGFSNLSSLIADLHEGTNKALPCGAGLGLLDVDGQGDVYLCHRFPGSESHRYGNVKQRASIQYDRMSEFVDEASLDNKPVCQTCWIRGLCGGGCYHEAQTTFGDALLPNLHYCGWLRQWAEFGIGVYLKLEEDNPGFIEQYVLRGRAGAPKELT